MTYHLKASKGIPLLAKNGENSMASCQSWVKNLKTFSESQDPGEKFGSNCSRKRPIFGWLTYVASRKFLLNQVSFEGL
jgi:hypothetical protein